MGMRSGFFSTRPFGIWSRLPAAGGVLVVMAFFSVLHAQNLLRSPESVVFDASDDRYFVSNAATGEIIQVDAEGNQSYFNTDQTSIRGLHMVEGHLYAASDAGIAVVDVASGATETVVAVPGADFLNDLVADDSGNLYCTDSGANRIIKVRLTDYVVSTFVGSGIATPNGLLFDSDGNRLLLCSFRMNAPIQAIDLADSTVSTVVETDLDNLDGLAVDNVGNVYVSSWGSEAVYRFDSSFQNPPEQISMNHQGPADIFFNMRDDILAVPNFNANTIDFVEVSFGSTIHVPQEYARIQDAIDAASYGDTVLVDEGTYPENINFRGKHIVVASHFLLNGDFDCISQTVISGEAPADPDTASTVVFSSEEGPKSILQGFTITGGTGTVWVDPDLSQYTWRGGGGVFMFRSSPTLKNNVIANNDVIDDSGVDGAQGGGILSYDGNPLIRNNLIVYNEARYGAGVVMDYSGGTLRNNIIAHNVGGQAYGGGGFWSIGNGSSPILIENNAIIANASLGTGAYAGRGGALFVWYGEVTARNNIIWDNTQTNGGPIAQIDGGVAHVSYSDVEGGFPGEGNIDEEPQFADSAYILTIDSPCIDAGDTSVAFNDPEDPTDPGSAQWPAMGGLRNDIGAYGGPMTAQLVEEIVSSDEESDPIARTIWLAGNVPNPSRGRTTITYGLNRECKARLTIHDISGRLLDTLVDGVIPAGRHSFEWKPRNLSSGIYLCSLSIDGLAVATRQLALIR